MDTESPFEGRIICRVFYSPNRFHVAEKGHLSFAQKKNTTSSWYFLILVNWYFLTLYILTRIAYIIYKYPCKCLNFLWSQWPYRFHVAEKGHLSLVQKTHDLFLILLDISKSILFNAVYFDKSSLYPCKCLNLLGFQWPNRFHVAENGHISLVQKNTKKNTISSFKRESLL